MVVTLDARVHARPRWSHGSSNGLYKDSHSFVCRRSCTLPLKRIRAAVRCIRPIEADHVHGDMVDAHGSNVFFPN